jgi:hypothetical protein
MQQITRSARQAFAHPVQRLQVELIRSLRRRKVDAAETILRINAVRDRSHPRTELNASFGVSTSGAAHLCLATEQGSSQANVLLLG